MNWAPIVVAIVVLAVVIPAYRRVRQMPDVPLLIWPVMLAAAAVPPFILHDLMNPKPAIETFRLEAEGDTISFTVPPQHSVLIRGDLDPEAEGTDAGKTDYSIRFKGDGWVQQSTSAVRQKTEGGLDVDATGDASLRSSTKRRSGKWGEDLEKRFDLKGSGDVAGELTLWNGKAAMGLDGSVFPSPFDGRITLGIFAVLAGLALWMEVKYRAEKLTGDIAFLVLYGVFLRHDTTPGDAFNGVLTSLLPSFLLGEGACAGIAWMLVRTPSGKDRKKLAEQGEA